MRFGIPLLLIAAATATAQAPQFTKDNQLLLPANYREWIFLSSGLGMTYGPAAAANRTPRFDNVFVMPAAYRSFMATGKWPAGAMFALEVREAESKGSINNGGHFQSGLVAVEVEVKDESRFPGKWGFFAFPQGAASAKQIPANASCYSCHSEKGAVDNTFVQFYPTLLEVARAKKTFTPAYLTSEEHSH